MKKPKIKIKKATLADLDSFWKFFQSSVQKQFPQYSLKAKNLFLKKYFTKAILRSDLKGKRIDLILVRVGRGIVGYLLTNEPYGGILYVSWLAVDKTFQSLGIGSLLLGELEKVAKGRDVHKVHLWTSKHNLKFYQKNKWILVGHIPQNYFGADDWLFYKTIQKPKY